MSNSKFQRKSAPTMATPNTDKKWTKEIGAEPIKTQTAEPKQPTREQFVAKLDRIIAIHDKANGQFDDGRERIYSGCAE